MTTQYVSPTHVSNGVQQYEDANEVELAEVLSVIPAGHSNSRHCRDLIIELGWPDTRSSERHFRKVTETLIDYYHFAIASTTRGFFHALTQDEFDLGNANKVKNAMSVLTKVRIRGEKRDKLIFAKA